MSRKYLLKRDKYDPRDFLFEATHKPVTYQLPESFDLRALAPPVYDQGDEGSCSANAGCAARSMLEKNAQIYLSRSFLYYNERLLEGTTAEDSGATLRDVVKSTKNYGICLDNEMPYVAGDFTEAPSAENYIEAKQYTIQGYSRLSGISNIMQALVSRNQPVLLGMDVFASMERTQVAQTGVLPMPKKNEELLGGHAVLVVGYTDKLPDETAVKLNEISFFQRLLNIFSSKKSVSGYLIVRNSWGESWGDKGYFFMPYDYVENGYAYDFWIME